MRSIGWIALSRHGKPLCKVTSEGVAKGVATKASQWHPPEVHEVFILNDREQCLLMDDS